MCNKTHSQCSIASANGWTVTVNVTPIQVVPEFTNCPWYYHYEIKFNYSITFTGSTVGRSFSANAYFNCTGGTGGTPYLALGTFTSNASGTLSTNNLARQYSNTSGTAYNYGSNPSCTTVTLANVNCTNVRLDYWGSGITNSSLNCNFSIPLPVELISFSGKPIENKVKLNWQTASETNNKLFVVERSTDTYLWQEVMDVPGAGNSNSIQSYEAIDVHPLEELSYYRLKQIDNNLNYKYSPIIAIDRSIGHSNEFILFPIPADKILTICGNQTIQAVNVSNQIGQILPLPIEYSDGCTKVNTSNLINGIYTLIIKSNNLSSAHKFVVSH